MANEYIFWFLINIINNENAPESISLEIPGYTEEDSGLKVIEISQSCSWKNYQIVKIAKQKTENQSAQLDSGWNKYSHISSVWKPEIADNIPSSMENITYGYVVHSFKASPNHGYESVLLTLFLPDYEVYSASLHPIENINKFFTDPMNMQALRKNKPNLYFQDNYSFIVASISEDKIQQVIEDIVLSGVVNDYSFGHTGKIWDYLQGNGGEFHKEIVWVK